MKRKGKIIAGVLAFLMLCSNTVTANLSFQQMSKEERKQFLNQEFDRRMQPKDYSVEPPLLDPNESQNIEALQESRTEEKTDFKNVNSLKLVSGGDYKTIEQLKEFYERNIGTNVYELAGEYFTDEQVKSIENNNSEKNIEEMYMYLFITLDSVSDYLKQDLIDLINDGNNIYNSIRACLKYMEICSKPSSPFDSIHEFSEDMTPVKAFNMNVNTDNSLREYLPKQKNDVMTKAQSASDTYSLSLYDFNNLMNANYKKIKSGGITINESNGHLTY